MGGRKKLYSDEEYRIRKNEQERLRRQKDRDKYLEGKKRHYETAKVKEGFKEKMADSAKTRYDSTIEYVRNVKLESGCCECGYNDCASSLLFHHVRGEKSFEVSSCYTRSLDSIKEEIAKCDIMCQNCHLKLHFDEDWEQKFKDSYHLKRIERRKFCNKLKEDTGCKECDCKDYRSLQFHHLDPNGKYKEVSMLYKRSGNVMYEEIAKCVIICGNCHMKLHENE